MTEQVSLPVQPRTIISEAQVRAALERLTYTSSPPPESGLTDLALVDQFLDDPDLPISPHLRAFALGQVLAQLITTALGAHRRVFGLADPDERASWETVWAAISADGWTNNPEVIGWSWLYYRYVRVDLHVSPQAFSQAVSIEERTLRRYQAHAIRRLTEQLIAAEWAARRQQRQRAGERAEHERKLAIARTPPLTEF